MILDIAAIVTERPGAGFAPTPCRLEGPRDDEVLVRIEAVGLCHTDLGIAAGYLPDFPFPVVLGHEGAGVVEAVGRAVHQVVAGDHVVITGPRCQNCRFCRDGRPAYCQRADELVFSCRRADGSTALSRTSLTADGGREDIAGHFFGQSSFASHAVAAAAGVVAIDRSMPFHLAAPLGCGVVTGWGTVRNHLRVREDETVIVIGFGAIALVGGSPPGSRVSVDPSDLLFSGKRLSGVRMREMVAGRDIPMLVEAWKDGFLPLERFVTTFPLGRITEAAETVARGECVKAVLLPDHQDHGSRQWEREQP